MITTDYFEFLDYWFYIVDVNVCPADTRNKKISDNWKPRQSKPISPDKYEAMKKEGAFNRGAAVVTGKVWRGNYVGHYLNGVDLDNQKAIQVCPNLKEDRTITIEELADAYAIRKTREWRRQHNNNTAGLGSWPYQNGW